MHAGSGWCEGCLRTLDEIAAWSRLDEAGKRGVLAGLPERRRQWRVMRAAAAAAAPAAAATEATAASGAAATDAAAATVAPASAAPATAAPPALGERPHA